MAVGTSPGSPLPGSGLCGSRAVKRSLKLSHVTGDPKGSDGQDQLLVSGGVWKMGGFLAAPLQGRVLA